LANKDLYIEFDIKKLKALKDSNDNREGVKYTGTDAPLNVYRTNFYYYKQAEHGQLQAKKQALINDKKLDSGNFNRLYDSVFTEFEHIEKAYVSENPSPYYRILENERLSDYYGQLCFRNFGKTMDENLWKRINRHKSLLVSNNGMLFYRYLYMYAKSLPINRSSVSLEDFVSIKNPSESDRTAMDSIKYYLRIIKEKQLPYDTAGHFQLIARFIQFERKLEPRFSQLLDEKTTKRIAYYLDSLFTPFKADLLKLQIDDKDPVAKKNIDSILLAGMHTEWTKKVLTTEYRQTVNKIAAINELLSQSSSKMTSLGWGIPIIQTPFGASLYKISDISASDFLVKLKSTFNNKALIMDFWATWCSPCLNEMPYGKKLHEELKGSPVEFVYLCTSGGSDETKWEAKIAELKQPGIHFFVDQSLESELMTRFSLTGFPGYVFFDKKGQYKPGAITWMSAMTKNKLSDLVQPAGQ
jgi:thiol-disulfide isomerase/thioredoxin